MIPLYGFLEGDTVGLLVLAGEHDTMAELAKQLMASASVRVRPKERVKVLHGGRVLDARATVRTAGLLPLDRIDVVEDAS